MIDMELSRSSRCLGDGLLGLAFRTHEEQPSTTGDSRTDGVQGLGEHRNGLGQIDDMDPVASSVDVTTHPWVPPVRLMSKMHTSLQKLAQSKLGNWHCLSFPVWPQRGKKRRSTGGH